MHFQHHSHLQGDLEREKVTLFGNNSAEMQAPLCSLLVLLVAKPSVLRQAEFAVRPTLGSGPRGRLQPGCVPWGEASVLDWGHSSVTVVHSSHSSSGLRPHSHL